MYTPEQLEMLKDTMREYLYFFNYTDHPNELEADPITTFFNYDGATQHDEAQLEQFFGGYKRTNADGLTRATSGNLIKGEFEFNTTFPIDLNVRALGFITEKLSIKPI